MSRLIFQKSNHDEIILDATTSILGKSIKMIMQYIVKDGRNWKNTKIKILNIFPEALVFRQMVLVILKK